MGLFASLFRRSAKGRNAVSFDDEGVVRTLPDGRTERVSWGELEKVSILTTDEGPMADDVYWMLEGKTGGCAVPSEAEGMKELMARLQQLPGFKNQAVIQAMGSTTNAEFVCWSRS
jgi:hypothetical protein